MRKNPRKSVFDILMSIEKDQAFSNLTLDAEIKNGKYDARDISFISALSYGVVERKLTLDYILGLKLTKPIKKLKPAVLIILRMGAYQLIFMDGAPVWAVVNESVELCKKLGHSYAAGLVNAVLKAVYKDGLTLPEADGDKAHYYSVKYSCDEWLVNLWMDSYGEENAIGIMESGLGRRPLFARVNTLKTDTDSLIEKLNNEGAKAEKVEHFPNAVDLTGSAGIENLPSFNEGLFHIQDLSSQACAEALDAKPGETVIDACSAPGGKTFTISQIMRNSGKIIAMDLYKSRLGLVKNGAERLGLNNIHTILNDASKSKDPSLLADKALCDSPCSGLGIIGRKPEIRYKSKESIDMLHDLQYLILKETSNAVKAGGRLIYSTCALNPAENEAVAERFLNNSPNFKVKNLCLNIDKYLYKNKGFFTFMPHILNTDGFFIAAFERMW